MEWYYAAGLMVGIILFLMALRIPVAFAFLLANLMGVIIFLGGGFGIVQLTANMTSALTKYSLVPIPLFLLMGELFFHTGIAQRVFMVVDRLMGNVTGRLSYVTIIGGTMFASLSGSSLANTAMMGSTMYPEMKSRNYNDFLSIGPVVATGGLAAIIPPSGLAVLLGSLAGINVGKLLLAGIVPGLMLASMYMLIVFIWTRFNPDDAPPYEPERINALEKVKLIVINLLPMLAVIFMVIGLIIFGIATPTESAAFGVVGVALVAVMFRALSWEAVKKSAIGAAKITGMIFLIILASTTFSQILSISGATRGLVNWVEGLDAAVWVVILAMGLILLVMGAFMEPVGIMMLTIPIFFPLAASFGIDPIWMGLYMLIFIELGLATPPFGLALYIMLGVAPDTNIVKVSIAVAPYLMCTLVLVSIITIWPDVVLWLPTLMQP